MNLTITGPGSSNVSNSDAEMNQVEENQILLAGTLIFFHFLGFLYIALPKLFEMMKPATRENAEGDLLIDEESEEEYSESSEENE